MKRFTILFLTVILMFTFSACSGTISANDAKQFTSDFLNSVQKGDYTSAQEFLHPESPADLKAFFEGIAKNENVDFSNMRIERYTEFKSSVYNASVAGSTYSLTIELSLSKKIVEFEFELVKNPRGYGIYKIGIDFD